MTPVMEKADNYSNLPLPYPSPKPSKLKKLSPRGGLYKETSRERDLYDYQTRSYTHARNPSQEDLYKDSFIDHQMNMISPKSVLR